jgi:hypothetical protein
MRSPYDQMAVWATGTWLSLRARAATAAGDNYDRLTQAKATHDPENVFRVNQNIQPGVSSG